MTTNKIISQTSLMRLCLARVFMQNAQSALKRGHDDLSLATAVVSMHDCIDNFLGVVSSELQAKSNKEDYLLTRFSEIGKVYKKKYNKSIPNRADIVLLNGIRNGVKHEGIFPNVSQVISLVNSLSNFCDTISMEIFGVKLSNVSLISQVKDEKKRIILESIEQNIKEKNYEEALVVSAVGIFEHLDSKAWNMNPLLLITATEEERNAKNIFPKRDSLKGDLDLLQLDIDPYLYQRFKNLVPEIGYDNHTDKNYIWKYNSVTWHKKNWTSENANFCLSFLTKLFLKQQRGYGGYTLTYKSQREKVVFVNESVVEVGLKKSELRKFKAGEELHGSVTGFINGKLMGFREGGPDSISLLEIKDGKPEFYNIKVKDVKVEALEESYRSTSV